MVLATLEVNGKKYVQECPDKKAAEAAVRGWLVEAKKNYPNKVFTPVYYAAKRLPAD